VSAHQGLVSPIAMLFLAVFLRPHNTLIVDAIQSASGTTKSLLVHLDGLIGMVIIFLLYRLDVRGL